MNEEIEKLNELIAKDEEIRQHGIKIIEKADLALENLKILELNIVPAVASNSRHITDLLKHTKELYDNQGRLVQSLLNLQAKFLQLEERIKTVEGESELIRGEMGWH